MPGSFAGHAILAPQVQRGDLQFRHHGAGDVPALGHRTLDALWDVVFFFGGGGESIKAMSMVMFFGNKASWSCEKMGFRVTFCDNSEWDTLDSDEAFV